MYSHHRLGTSRFQLLRFGRRSTLKTTDWASFSANPPSLRHAPASVWQRIVFWLLAPAPHEASPPLNRLPMVRNDFLACVHDAEGPAAEGLRNRIRQAHSLRDLWHMRTDVFRVVGLFHSQAEAQRRLELLKRHFPASAANNRVASRDAGRDSARSSNLG